MDFQKYQHVERFGNKEVDGIELGLCHVFPKIDGTNASVWLEDGEIFAGSRNRKLTFEKDNAGFFKWAVMQDNIRRYLTYNPDHRLYGEWLVPHSLKTYRDDSWRRFYVFDVLTESGEYVPYDIYSKELEAYEIDYIPLLCKIKNGSYDQFIKKLESNTFLIQDGKGSGEGIVIKNYDFYNQFGRQIWAKIVRTEFKELHSKTMGTPEHDGSILEEKIVNECLTSAFVEKEYCKIAVDGWESKRIPRLLDTVWHEFVTEETFNILKKYKNPKIDFKLLQRFVTAKIKEIKPEIF